MNSIKKPRTCISPDGSFIHGIHKPSYAVRNHRPEAVISKLGKMQDNTPFLNNRNFPEGDVKVDQADWIFEIPNAFAFRGTTYIDKEWADASSKNPEKIRLPETEKLSFSSLLSEHSLSSSFLKKLPRPLLLALATTSTDPEDLITLAELSCDFDGDESGTVQGLVYEYSPHKGPTPIIHDHDLFEAVANNPSLPDPYKISMVIRPGAQGGSEIVGEWTGSRKSHIYEYLRRNSYIAGGHYAANMAENAIRYSMDELAAEDMTGLRHLYYQRTYVRLAELLQLDVNLSQETLSQEELENLRLMIEVELSTSNVERIATLWGWNFGFDFSPTGYRLHASHQQIHQQYAIVPEAVETYLGDPEKPMGKMECYSLGDLVSNVVEVYANAHDSDFFRDYFTALNNNKRMDGRSDLNRDLIVWEDSHAMLFVPKAQTSQWELQLMTKINPQNQCPGNIMETNTACRHSLDKGILLAQKALAGRGARMVTSIEYSKRLGARSHYIQPLIYAFLPRLPQSPGAFSEAQLRFINGHYPEDFAAVCKQELSSHF